MWPWGGATAAAALQLGHALPGAGVSRPADLEDASPLFIGINWGTMRAGRHGDVDRGPGLNRTNRSQFRYQRWKPNLELNFRMSMAQAAVDLRGVSMGWPASAPWGAHMAPRCAKPHRRTNAAVCSGVGNKGLGRRSGGKAGLPVLLKLETRFLRLQLLFMPGGNLDSLQSNDDKQIKA